MASKQAGKAQAEFDFLQEVGRGSYGVVTKVCRKRDGKVCVIKSVLLERLGTERERTLALNEAKIMKDLHCPHIVEYLDAFTERGTLYLVLEYCQLGNLKAHYLRSPKAIAMPKVWRIGLRIAMGLEYLHARRVLHRDIKSENILLMPEDEVRIADLGLAKQLSSSMVGATTMCGTPRYLSPEMAKGAGCYSEKCDVWALGVILYEMCSANHQGPWISNTLPDLLYKIQHQEVPVLPKRTDLFLRDLIGLRLLEKEPSLRPSAADILVLPGVVESAAKHGISLERERPDGKDRRTASSKELVPSRLDLPQRPASMNSQDRPSAGTFAPSNDFSEGLISHGEVPDGFCSKLSKVLGRGSNEPGLGPRFHRLGFCELCFAQNLPNHRFSLLRRRHHCRNCGRSVCHLHCSRHASLPHFGHVQPQRICDLCSLIPSAGGEEDNRCVSRERQHHWVLTGRSGSQALAWDSRSLTSPTWTLPEKLIWMGVGHDGAGSVVCSLSSHPGACLQIRALETGEVVRSTPLPLEAGVQSSAPPGPTSISYGPSRTGSRLSRVATVDAVASRGEWFAVARRDWAVSLIHVLGLTSASGACIGYCSVEQVKVTALALQDGPEGFVAAGLHSGEVWIWDIPGSDEPCRLLCRLEGHRQSVTSLAIAPTFSVVCSGSSSCLRLWRRQADGNFQENPHPKACDDHVATGSGAISCAGSLLAFVRKPKQGTWEKGVALWDLGLGRLERELFKKGHSVGCIALCGSLLATSDGSTPRGSCTVQLWYAHTGTPLAMFRNPSPVNLLSVAATQPPKAARGCPQA